MNRVIFFIAIGLGGAAILIGLGVWQVQRLAWKQAVIADINTRIAAEPIALPDAPTPETDAYLPVTVTGRYAGDTLRVLISQKTLGAGYRLITALEGPEGRILVDRGFIATDDKGIATPDGDVTITGNLQWPQEADGFTPAPDFDNNIWFAREVPKMAAVLDTRPVLVVARSVSEDDPVVTPLPVVTAHIPNDHLQYAITWFSLAAIWLAMSLYFVRRKAPASES